MSSVKSSKPQDERVGLWRGRYAAAQGGVVALLAAGRRGSAGALQGLPPEAAQRVRRWLLRDLAGSFSASCVKRNSWGWWGHSMGPDAPTTLSWMFSLEEEPEEGEEAGGSEGERKTGTGKGKGKGKEKVSRLEGRCVCYARDFPEPTDEFSGPWRVERCKPREGFLPLRIIVDMPFKPYYCQLADKYTIMANKNTFCFAIACHHKFFLELEAIDSVPLPPNVTLSFKMQ
ncbi:hypothetical protein Pelo_313 [Pelomyxa schiedti]|nr:hypothetical protein Pelo_313 [Pelomyxa schiedti]